MSTRLVCAGVVALLWVAGTAEAQEYRGFWVDTFNTSLNNQQDVDQVIERAKAAKVNALFVQVRRRGDSWYLNSLEPLPDTVPIQPGFDPLQAVIDGAHANGLEVHAFVIVGAIFNRHPGILGPPASPQHVFNRHGGWDPATGVIVQGPDNWLTRTLIPDGTANVSFQGHRIGAEFWLDLGHPAAAADTVEVLMHLVRNYDIDGLHLDRIRYPEIGITGQTPTTGASIGYNFTNVARFKRRHGIAPDVPPPSPGDPLWAQWRRDQVTAVVRRIYLEAVAIKPHLKISASLIAFSGAPAAWTSAEPYWRVYQDWRGWTEEGILDLAMVMNYKREEMAGQAAQYNSWLTFMRDNQYNRMVLDGQGAFLNGIEGTLRQVRRSQLPSPTTGATLGGTVFFSMATSNIAVPANPFSFPPGENTPARPFAEFASALTTGRSVDGTIPYEDQSEHPVPLFAQPAFVPVLAWKANPLTGHLRGVVRDEDGAVVDTGAVLVSRAGATPAAVTGRTSVTTATDGNGYYGAVDLAPGTYTVTVTPPGQAPFTGCPAVVEAGTVGRLDLVIDRAAPSTTITATPDVIWPPAGQHVTVTLGGTAGDTGTGVEWITFRVIDEYGEVEPAIPAVGGGGAASVEWQRTVSLLASRRGDDTDGRTYRIEATVIDGACNTAVFSTVVTVVHDLRP